MTTLPDRRVIHDGGQDVDLEERDVRKIEDAICNGKQIRLVVGERKSHKYKPEACVTRFVDPVTGVTRWAVESWDGSGSIQGMFKADHATEAAAIAEYHVKCDRLGI